MVTMSNIDFESPSDIVTQEALDAVTRKAVAKPDITKLPDAIVGGVAQFKEGDKLVIERYSTFLAGKPYLDTKTYRVVRHDEFTGRMHLFDEQLDQNAIMNWKEGMRFGTVFKLATGKVDISTKRKRGRPKKEVVDAPPPSNPTGEKRGRGRPKGAKNRPKEVIAAEKAAMKVKRAEKAKKRVAKKKVSVVTVAAPPKPTKKVAKKPTKKVVAAASTKATKVAAAAPKAKKTATKKKVVKKR
jgi:hypothetical protein